MRLPLLTNDQQTDGPRGGSGDALDELAVVYELELFKSILLFCFCLFHSKNTGLFCFVLVGAVLATATPDGCWSCCGTTLGHLHNHRWRIRIDDEHGMDLVKSCHQIY